MTGLEGGANISTVNLSEFGDEEVEEEQCLSYFLLQVQQLPGKSPPLEVAIVEGSRAVVRVWK